MLICTSAQAFAVAYQGEEHLVAPMLLTTHKHILSNQRQFKAENTACNPALGRSLCIILLRISCQRMAKTPMSLMNKENSIRCKK